jgi:hypothetical protein
MFASLSAIIARLNRDTTRGQTSMTIDNTGLGLALGFLGLAGTVIGLGVAVCAWRDARRQRSKREKAVIAAHSVVERTYGLLIGIKPFVEPLGDGHKAAVNNGLQAIDQRRDELDAL